MQGYPSNQGYTSNQGMPQYADQPNYGQYGETLYNKEQPEGGVNFTQAVRLGFIRKVYGIVSAQLLVSLVFVIAGMFFNPKNISVLTNQIINILYVICTITIITTAILICCCFRRSFPANYICLGIFTLAESFILFLFTSTFPAENVLLALAMTAAMTIGLTIYAMTTKTDFTYCGALLWMFSLGLIIFWILFYFMMNKYKFSFYYIIGCMAGIIIYSLYLIYDTQLMIGKFDNEYSVDDYVFAAINIYLDIINLFIYILQFISAVKGN